MADNITDDHRSHSYDAILIVSFGGPEGPNDVMPFLDNVLAGLKVPTRVKKQIAKRYANFGGVSPINGETRAFISALETELRERGITLPIYWGNRNWHPLLSDTFKNMETDRVRRAIVHVTSMFSSYSGCRKYREDLYAATANLEHATIVDKLRLGFNHPNFIAAVMDRTESALNELPTGRRDNATLLFTAHSLPQTMADNSDYVAQLREACSLVVEGLGQTQWDLVYQSNNASYGNSWLEPDIGNALLQLGEDGVEDIVIVPIGFVCDHMEVVFDLDIEAREIAEKAGVNMVRAATVGSHPAYISMVCELIEERLSPDRDRLSLGGLGPSHDVCPPNCCLSGRPGKQKPALCGADGT